MDGWELAEIELEDTEQTVPAVVRPDGWGLTLETVSTLIDLDLSDPEAFDLLMDLLEAFLERLARTPCKADEEEEDAASGLAHRCPHRGNPGDH